MSISIEDYEVKQPILVANSIKIEVDGVVLFKTAKLRITFLRDDVYLSSDIYYLTQEEYNAWGEDDTYLETLVFEKYGFKLPTDTEPQSELKIII
jgi:hypothetical protein